MNKIKLGLIYGGVSSEHDISIKSCDSVLKYIDYNKYDVYKIYIDKSGDWYESNNDLVKKIDNIINYLKSFDVIFPILHGKNGEDGRLQGLLELFKIKYIGCKVLSSALCMDKVYTKEFLKGYNIDQVNYFYLKKSKNKYIYYDSDLNENIVEFDNILDVIENKIKYPMYVKPSSCGSSVGINRVGSKEELIYSIKEALKYDDKIIIEEECNALEVECALLDGIPSTIGMVVPNDRYYSYDEKYINNKTKIMIPADISYSESEYIKNLASKIYRILDCKDLCRIDFFIDKKTRKIYLNEVNTMPGFTTISMYSKLWEDAGISYSSLVENLIELADQQ